MDSDPYPRPIIAIVPNDVIHPMVKGMRTHMHASQGHQRL